MKITNVRHEVGYEHEVGYSLGTQIKTPEAGVYAILKYELGYGGRVQSIDEDRMVVKTRVLAKIDTVTVEFETDEEHKMMAAALHYWLQAVDDVDPVEVVEPFIKATKGNAFLITHALPLIVGQSRVKRTLLLALGLADKPDVVKRLVEVGPEETVAVAELVREGYSYEDALSTLDA